jgi:hypothetical protein
MPPSRRRVIQRQAPWCSAAKSVMAMSDKCPGITAPRDRERKYSAVRSTPKESQSAAIPPARSASDHNNRRPNSISPALSIWTPFCMRGLCKAAIAQHGTCINEIRLTAQTNHRGHREHRGSVKKVTHLVACRSKVDQPSTINQHNQPLPRAPAALQPTIPSFARIAEDGNLDPPKL